MKIPLLFICVFLILWGVIGQAQEIPNNTSVVTNVESFFADSEKMTLGQAVLCLQELRESLSKDKNREIAIAINKIGKSKLFAAAPLVAERLDMVYSPLPQIALQTLPRANAYPAIAALKRMGLPTFPYLIDVCAHYDPTNRLLIDESYRNAIQVIESIRPQDPVKQTLHLASEEYMQRSKRLILLSKQVDSIKPLIDNGKNPDKSRVEQNEQKARIANVEEALEIILRLDNSATFEVSRLQIERDIQRLGELKLGLSAKVLTTYLDFTPKVAVPENKTEYPAVNALVEIGRPALPDLVTALTNSKTKESFRSNGLLAFVTIVGEKKMASEILLAYAKDYTKKHQNLQKT